MNVELANLVDETLLEEILNDERYEWIKSYDINIKLFYKYGKYDKDGNLKTPALVKNGKPIPLSLKIVSSFNRLTDNVDVKIIINKDLWDEYNTLERTAALDGILYYLELKTDKLGEPIPISEENNKVQLKLKKPDFFCEGFVGLAEKYGNNYYPIRDAKTISNIKMVSSNNKSNVTKSDESVKSMKSTEVEEEIDEYDDVEVDLNDIEI